MLQCARVLRRSVSSLSSAYRRRVGTHGLQRSSVSPLAAQRRLERSATVRAARYPDEVIQAPKGLGVRSFAAKCSERRICVECAPETDTSIRVTINVPAQRCDDAYNTVMAELRKDYNVPGFRNNEKVPVDMLVQAAGGERQAFEKVPHEVIEGTIKVESDAEALLDQFQRNTDLQYIVTAETGDIGVKFSGPYTGMQITVSEVNDQAREDLKVHQALTRFLRDRGGSLNVAQRGAQLGDTLVIDFEVRAKENQEPIPALTQDKHELDCLSEENFLPGVMPQMMGMQVGEMRTFDFSFPDPWEPAELAGLEALVKVKVREVLGWELPELTLEMCQTVQPEITSTEEFMKELREAVKLQAKDELQARIQSTILENLGNITMLERIPASPFETFALGRYEGRLHEALENGVIKQEQLKELTEEQHVRDYIEGQRKTLEKEFAVLMAVDEIYKVEKLQVDETEVDSLVEGQREEFKKAGKITTLEQVKEYIRSELQQRVTIEYLQEQASVTIEPYKE